MPKDASRAVPPFFWLAGLLLLAGGLYCFRVKPGDSGPIFRSSTTVETRQALTLEQAKADCPIPLPPEAGNIRFAAYREWKAACTLVTFEAPTEVCLRHAAGLLPQAHLSGDTLRPPRNPAAPYFDLPTPWFAPESIRQGVWSPPGTDPTIWIDTARGVFYYQGIE